MNGTFSGTADVGNTLSVISQASPSGFLQILVFLLIAIIILWQYMEHRDRIKTKGRRDELWTHHMELHEANEKSVEKNLNSMSKTIDIISNKQDAAGIEFRKGINDIQVSIAVLKTTLELYSRSK